MSKSRSTLRSTLNTYLNDENDMLWTQGQKDLAINLAIQATWPDIKAVAKTSFTLTAGSYNYVLSALTRAPWGPAQVWCATSSTSTPVYREMRRSVIIHQDGDAYSLEFEKGFVDNRGGYIVQAYYNQQYPELSTDAETTDAPEGFLMPRAAYELCTMMMLTGHHRELDAFAAKSADFFEVSERARMRHQVLPLPTTIRLRWE